MKTHILSGIRLTLICLLFFSGIYTILIWGIAQFSPNTGEGFVIKTEKGKIYYTNIGQKFNEERYFWSRPSAVDYNAAGAGGSNKGPTNPDYLKTVEARADSFLVHHPGLRKEDIPSELLTASGSGIDPDISVGAARVQIKRISRARNIPEANLEELILGNTESALAGIFGPAKVNVLKLNLALDNLQ